MNAFVRHVGPLFICDVNGERRCAFVADERHCNSLGTVHGGMLMSFADMAFATISEMDPIEPSTSVSFNFEFLAAAQMGDVIEARAEVIRRGGSLIFIRGQLLVGTKVLVNCSAVEKRLRRI